MKLVVAGSRYYDDYNEVRAKLLFFIQNVTEEIEIVSGACDRGTHTFTRPDGTKIYGADGLGERFAEEMGFPVKYFPPNYKKYGNKSVYYFRNKQMAEYCTHGIVFGKTKGSAMMLRLLQDHSKPNREIKI